MVDTGYLVDDYNMITGSRQSAIVRVSLTDHRCFVHLISVEFSEYNIELVDLVDFRYLNSTQLSDDRLDRSTSLQALLSTRLASALKRSTQSIDSIDFGVYYRAQPLSDSVCLSDKPIMEAVRQGKISQFAQKAMMSYCIECLRKV